jgi:hypothetical protein
MELTPRFWYCFFQVILDNMIDNGSFEVLTIDFESLTSSILQSPSTALKNWVVNSGNVKLLRGSRFQSSDNSSSVLDMNGNTGGSIITYFGTTPKSTYAILLDIATNPDIAETDKQGIPEQCSTKLEVTVKVQATGKTLLTDLVTVSSYMLPQVSSQSQTKENPSQMSILLCTWKILMHCASSQMWLVCASELFIDVNLMCHMHFLHRCESYVHLWQCLSDMLKKFQNSCGISLYNGANLGLDPGSSALKHLKQLGSSSDWDAKILFSCVGFCSWSERRDYNQMWWNGRLLNWGLMQKRTLMWLSSLQVKLEGGWVLF